MDKIVSTTEMLIRKPAEDVFNAFVDPRIIEKFWLKRASGPLANGVKVEWEFMVPGARDTVTVTEFVQGKVIAFSWSNGVAVRMEFHLHEHNSTRLSVTASGFAGAYAVSQAIGTTEGFAIVLCDLKSLLETGHSGGMVRDKAVLITAAKTAE